MKFFLNLLLLLILIPFVNSKIYFNEINFISPEYVEIYSDTHLNLSNSNFFDDGGPNHANSLTIVKKTDSHYYLIVGNDFLHHYNITNMNCSIYKTGKSNLGYRSLKDNGENITFLINDTYNLSWYKIKNLNFKSNQTLNYNTLTGNYLIENTSICGANLKNISKNTNKTNDNQTTNSVLRDSCNYDFKIKTENNFFKDKAEYSFQTNAKNFTIRYWIENYEGKIMKNKRNTTNFNKKYYSAKTTDIFFIKADLYTNNCSINVSKQIAIHVKNENNKNIPTIPSKNMQNFDQNSYIKILNYDELLNKKTNILQYEVYRGNTQKRTVYVYENSKKLTSFDIEKYSKIKAKITLPVKKGNRSISVFGLGREKDLKFSFPKSTNNLSFEKNQFHIETFVKNYFEIRNFSLNKTNLSFLFITKANYTSFCYVDYKKTKVSNILNLTTKSFSNLIKSTIFINESLIKKIKLQKNYALKLICKYKKVSLKTYLYKSQNFNYTLEQNSTKNYFQKNLTKLDLNYFSSFNKSKKTNIAKKFKNSLFSEKLLENSQKIFDFQENQHNKNSSNYTSIYVSTNVNTKKNSIYPVFAGVVVLFSVFLLKW